MLKKRGVRVERHVREVFDPPVIVLRLKRHVGEPELSCLDHVYGRVLRHGFAHMLGQCMDVYLGTASHIC